MPTANVNGHDLFYAEDNFADPWRPPETVLMQHFVFGNHRQFTGWVPALAAECRVIRMDRWGNGLSSSPPFGYQYNLEDLLSDFIGFLDALGLERVHYIGDSLGGVLGAAFAAKHPDRVKSLVMCASPCWIKPETQKGFLVEGYSDGPSSVMGAGSWAFAHARWTRDLPPGTSSKAILRSIHGAEQTAMMSSYVIASLMRMVSRRDFDITPLLPNIQAPALLLSPGNSVNTSLEEQAMMKDAIPDSEQVVFEGAGHGIAVTQPDRCAAEALAFIRRHSA